MHVNLSSSPDADFPLLVGKDMNYLFIYLFIVCNQTVLIFFCILLDIVGVISVCVSDCGP